MYTIVKRQIVLAAYTNLYKYYFWYAEHCHLDFFFMSERRILPTIEIKSQGGQKWIESSYVTPILWQTGEQIVRNDCINKMYVTNMPKIRKAFYNCLVA